MKNLFMLLFLLTSLGLTAQKELKKEIDYNNELVQVDLKFASDIQIKTWDKSIIQVEASVEFKEEEYYEMFDLTISSDESRIEISSNSEDIFETHHENNRSIINYSDAPDHEFNYTLYVPKGVDLKVSSITANVTSDFLQGNIAVNLVSGDINIKKYSGDLELKSVAGKIDVNYTDASLKAKTLTGKIYTREELKLEKKKKFIGQEIENELANTANSLTLDTVSGDIYLN